MRSQIMKNTPATRQTRASSRYLRRKRVCAGIIGCGAGRPGVREPAPSTTGHSICAAEGLPQIEMTPLR
jgi:hypothetical protein